jgi:uncharacterized membrane protein (DUF4010 family)
MEQDTLVSAFVQFGLAGLLGFLVGLERAMSAKENPHAGLRDFVIFALLGATSAFVAGQYDSPWLIAVVFFGVLALLLSGYWADQDQDPQIPSGITTEISAIVTFLLGVLVMKDAEVLAVALAIVMLAVLSQKRVLTAFSSGIKFFELEAALKFLIITFIVLPILPNRSLDTYLTYPIGVVSSVDEATRTISFTPSENQGFEAGQRLMVYAAEAGPLGEVEIIGLTTDTIVARDQSTNLLHVPAGTEVHAPLAPKFLMTMLSALKPFKIWLIVVLVSFISFIGYILIKVMGHSAGIGLTGLIGGLASSTVTTLSFSRRSREYPDLNRHFAIAVLLASSVMFPRLLVQIGVFNQALMRNMALPIIVTGGTGLVLAAIYYLRSREPAGETEEVSFDNPFSLKAALAFGMVFATILMITRLAITYLGDAWLPVVAIVSGLTDADAIAFSLSDAERAGLISLDWASFNLVLGALSNTFMKLFLVFSLGHRGLFKHLLVSFLIMGAAGLITMLLYYDLGAIYAGATASG